MNTISKDALQKVYKDHADEAQKRFETLCKAYGEKFGNAEVSFFTAPGRTEIIGNHTDHNGGKVIAASIDLDTIGVAARNDSGTIEIVSEGYPAFSVDIDHLEDIPKENGTISLVAGMIECAKKRGFQVGGFNLYASTNVIAAAGVSSSASFEMLVATILNTFFNEGKMTFSDYAIIGQYGENVWWNKASGRMDQMACAVGGPILLDFADEIEYEKIPFGFDEYGYTMVITNTGKGHADLSAEYSAVPNEMFSVAKHYGKERLCELDGLSFLSDISEVRKAVNNDRAVLRAMHFFAETNRVELMAEKVQKKDIEAILGLIDASGRSSYELLQDCFLADDPTEQPIALALALTGHFLFEKGRGICRVHGGGFAGVIQTIIPKEDEKAYVDYMSEYYGRENVYPMNIRQTGAVCLG